MRPHNQQHTTKNTKNGNRKNGEKMSQITLEDHERRMINMSALKSSSYTHQGNNNPDQVIQTAEKYVQWILNYKTENTTTPTTSTAEAEEPATEKQKEYMKKLGIPVPENLTKKQASQMIDEYLNKKAEGKTNGNSTN